jgi:hypothetical protein
VFFILAAVCFSKSSPRLLAWVLSLPKVGPLVRDHRAGLGMPRAAKVSALLVLAVAGASSYLVLPSPGLRVLLVVLLAVGVGVIGWGVPTRERILARRAGGDPGKA